MYDTLQFSGASHCIDGIWHKELNRTREKAFLVLFLSFFFFFTFLKFIFKTSLPLAGNSGLSYMVKTQHRKSSTTHSYQCVQYFSTTHSYQCVQYFSTTHSYQCVQYFSTTHSYQCVQYFSTTHSYQCVQYFSTTHSYQCVQKQHYPFLSVCAKAALPIPISVCKSSTTHSYQCVQYFRGPDSGMAASVWDF